MAPTTFELPARPGEKPATSAAMPHLQLSQNAGEATYQALAAWLFSLEYVEERRSRVSIPSTRAAWISYTYHDVNPLAEREFTHIHTEPGPGSQHMGLPAADAAEVVAKGWGEFHPVNDLVPDYDLVMVYAPRDAADLEVIKRITTRAYQFVLNQL